MLPDSLMIPSFRPVSELDVERTVGITTTVPVELIFAAGLRPVDLNNAFIASPEASQMVAEAEAAGFPRNCCCWAKGVYAAARRLRLRRIVAVVQGDCSNTEGLAELLTSEAVEVIPFSYPYGREQTLLNGELERFARRLGTQLERGEDVRRKLDAARRLAHEIDELTWRDGQVSGAENHAWLISCSDFLGEPDSYASQASAFLEKARSRQRARRGIRLGLAGIPPICEGLFELLEERAARVLFNEIPRQFAMPFAASSLVDQYRQYTYPYGIFGRLVDIKRAVTERRLDGLIHYVQSFCYRQIQDPILRKELDLPILTIECDRPGPLDASTRTRVEAFLELLHDRRRLSQRQE